jgi:thiosulfate/3-mercaptopyruvate sulfurtransferase
MIKNRAESSHEKTYSQAQQIIMSYGIILTILLGLFHPASANDWCLCKDEADLDAWWSARAVKPNPEPLPAPDDVGDALAEDIPQEDVAELSNDTAYIDDLDNASKPDYPCAELLESFDTDWNGLVILDARSPEEYQEGHIEDARNLYWRSIQSEGSLNIAQAVSALQNIGVNSTDPIAICGGLYESSYLFWALDYIGHENISILDDDIENFDHELDHVEPALNKSDYTVQTYQELSFNETFLETALKSPYYQLLDGRTSLYDRGIAHLRGDIVMPADQLCDDKGNLKDADELEALFSRLDKNKVQIIYGTPEACSLYFSLKLMGYNATVLDGDQWKKSKLAASSIS